MLWIHNTIRIMVAKLNAKAFMSECYKKILYL